MDSNSKRNRSFGINSSLEIPKFKARSSPSTRIVYIIPPKIIETDAANFRALVQKLTGKDSCRSSEKQLPKHKRKKLSSVIKLEQFGSSCLQDDYMGLCSNSSGQNQFLTVEDQHAKVKSEFIEDHSVSESWENFSYQFERDGDLDMFTAFDVYQQLPFY